MALHYVPTVYRLLCPMPLGLQLRFVAPPPLLLFPLPSAVFHKQLFAEHCIEPGIFLLLALSALSRNFQRALLTQHTDYGISPSTYHLQLDVEEELP